MSVTLLEKAMDLHREVCDYNYYFGVNEFTDEENVQAIVDLYNLLQKLGEAGTIQWLIDNEWLENE